jgi:hypothetical protein
MRKKRSSHGPLGEQIGVCNGNVLKSKWIFDRFGAGHTGDTGGNDMKYNHDLNNRLRINP